MSLQLKELSDFILENSKFNDSDNGLEAPCHHRKIENGTVPST